jgi:hypothetical protein
MGLLNIASLEHKVHDGPQGYSYQNQLYDISSSHSEVHRCGHDRHSLPVVVRIEVFARLIFENTPKTLDKKLEIKRVSHVIFMA